MKNGKLRVALVGVSFGAEFVPIYLKHPDVDSLVLVDTNRELLDTIGNKFLLEERLTDFSAMLEDETIDAVHLVTPPATHAPMSIQVMNAGKHCACTIPMGMSIEELYQVIAARKRSGKHYMFMETSVYGREFLYVKDLYEKGELGRIQFMRCAHYQDMEGWPDYWLGFPPLMHPTHAVAPCLMLLGKRPEAVYCKGSGKVRKEVEAPYGCPFAFESALISRNPAENSTASTPQTTTVIIAVCSSTRRVFSVMRFIRHRPSARSRSRARCGCTSSRAPRRSSCAGSGCTRR